MKVYEAPNVPHDLDGKAGFEKVRRLMNKCKKLQKMPVKRRTSQWQEKVSEVKKLFEAASCPRARKNTNLIIFLKSIDEVILKKEEPHQLLGSPEFRNCQYFVQPISMDNFLRFWWISTRFQY